MRGNNPPGMRPVGRGPEETRWGLGMDFDIFRIGVPFAAMVGTMAAVVLGTARLIRFLDKW